MKKKFRFLGIIPALALSSMLTFGAGTQGVVDDVIDGAENIVTDTIDTADDILTGDETTVGESAGDVAALCAARENFMEYSKIKI